MPEPTETPGPPGAVAGTFLEPLLARCRVDFVPADPQPAWGRVVLATVVALAASLGADAAVVAVGRRVFPSTVHFAHVAVSSYAKLTVIGVLVACAAWPVVTRVSSRPRWVFLRAAVAVTVVLLAPDAYLWLKHESHAGILVLVVMHLVIAVVTYNALVRIAPAGEADAEDAPSGTGVSGHG